MVGARSYSQTYFDLLKFQCFVYILIYVCMYVCMYVCIYIYACCFHFFRPMLWGVKRKVKSW